MEQNYIHDKAIHNTKAPRQIVPIILSLYNPKSVIDIGCGIGTWLTVFKDKGIFDYKGVDSDFVNRDLLMIEDEKFIAVDLTKGFSAPRKYDIALSLEVAEHLPESSADIFVKTLVSLSDTIIFSAAIKGQEGQNHLNEQSPFYWQNKFKVHNYILVYDFSPDIWNNCEIEWWYKQNIFVYQRKNSSNKEIELNFYIHPELYSKKLEEINELKLQNQNLYKGRIQILDGFKILIKSLLNFNRYNK